jgi:molecular chaperone HtpG
MEKKPFQAESQRLMSMMINSIYTHKEVFLRELISNASDALDKLFIREISENRNGIQRENLEITIERDLTQRILTISDNGCGMTEQEMADNLGIIAKSGTLEFKNEQTTPAQVIGQFGVGFYSAFMVSKKVQVISKAFGQEQSFCWESEGEDGFTLEPSQKESHGTKVILFLRDDSEDENFSEYLEEYTLQRLVKKYSDYIRYPIRMEVEEFTAVEDAESKTNLIWKTLNSMVPVWRLPKEELDEKANQFYKDKFFDFKDPLHKISIRIEGVVSYHALLYVPSEAPYGYYTKNFEKGLQLYSNDVLIMENCPDLLPDYFAFVRGVVDSADFSLNISRETLQHDRQLKLIAKNVEKRIRSELIKMLAEQRELYETFWKAFGLQIKYGIYAEFGMHKEDLKDLVLFHSLQQNKLVTLKEYLSSMPEGQKEIYYATGENLTKISLLPQSERIRDKGFDVLCMTDEVDEFAIKVLREYEGKVLRSVTDAKMDIMDEDEKEALEILNKENQSLLHDMTQALENRIKAVRLSTRLKNNPLCLVSEGEISLEMERVLSAMPNQERAVKAERILEVNPHHKVFETLQNLAGQPDKLKQYTKLLYDQALLMSGFSVEDPVAFSNAIIEFMTKTSDDR